MAKLREECGVVGVLGDPEAANLIYLGLYALQHRGQEACGIVCFDNDEKQERAILHGHKAFGLVGDAINREILEKLQGDIGIGHVRYSTSGGRLLQNIQPFSFRSPRYGHISIAHNGNLTNAKIIREELEAGGAIFSTTSDTEVFMHLLARSRRPELKDRIVEVMGIVRGAYSLVIAAKDVLFAVRDPFGYRPLVIGKKGNATIVASETCALDLLDASDYSEVQPGEIIEITRTGRNSSFPFAATKKEFCSFEPIYFARPDSYLFEDSIYDLRKKMGEELASESQVEADHVIAIPDSGMPMAIGYSNKSKIPIELGLIRNHYVGRTFIEPSQEIRDFGVKLKLNPVSEKIRGKKIILVDDSIVRGTTSVKIVRMLRKAGAKEIHFRVGSPPITHSCYYGVDTPARKDLLAAQKTVKEIKELIGVDSLAYLSLEGLKRALGKDSYCFACFNGKYQEEIFKDVPFQPTDVNGPGLSSLEN
ncbi:MAG: amidophosphoribosyltransferase [Bdellovibrionota bacterium]